MCVERERDSYKRQSPGIFRRETQNARKLTRREYEKCGGAKDKKNFRVPSGHGWLYYRRLD